MRHFARVSALGLVFAAAIVLPMEATARPPLFVIDPIDDQAAQANRHFQYQATFRVKDETCWMGGVSFDLTKAPPGMTITNSGKISWIPDADLICEPFQVVVHATAPTPPGSPCNGNMGQDSESFTIDVAAPTSPAPVVGPYFHNIIPQDFSSTDTGLKILVDVPPEASASDVEEYIIRESGRDVAVIPANRTGKLQFVEIDDYPLSFDAPYEYELYARVNTFQGCRRILEEREVKHNDISERANRRTRHIDGIDAREAALRHRPLLVFDASEIYWPVSIEWIMDNADLASFRWEGGPQLSNVKRAGTYTEEELMIFSHQMVGVDYLSWENFHQDAERDQGALLDYRDVPHPQYRHQVDSNNANHNMGLSPATFGDRLGCDELFSPIPFFGEIEERYYDCHVDRNDGRDLWDVDFELTEFYRAPNPGWKLYYAVYPYDADGDGIDDEYEIVYQMWNSWDANWEDGDNIPGPFGTSEFITRHEGDQTTIRVYTSDHGKTASLVTGGMHGMPLYVIGKAGTIKDRGFTEPQEFQFFGRPRSSELDNIFLYEAGADPYAKPSYQTPAKTFRAKHAYWSFDNDNPNATHPVMFIAGRSHGSSPVPGVLQSTLESVTALPPLILVDIYLRDAFTGTGLRWFPTEDQLVPIETAHPAFFHYVGWTGNWDRQERRGRDPGWVKEVTPPHSPYNILRPSGGPGDLSQPVRAPEKRVLWWAGDETRHGPRGPFAW
ncbi:MAG: hypothetical protein ACE5IQ_00520 [Candidatus Methylomirabilales bacterium]